MCIIAYCKERTLTQEEFDNCFDGNPDGVGIAFQHKKHVCFIKGLMEKESAWKQYQKLKLEKTPHIVHFRFGTSGGKTAEMTHPFIIDKRSPLKLKYAGKQSVLFHNGVITEWKNWEMPLYITNKVMPVGDMSDTRLASILLATLGEDVITRLSGKYIVMLPEDIHVYGDFIEEKGVLFSNNGYEHRSYRTYVSSYGHGSSYYKHDDSPWFNRHVSTVKEKEAKRVKEVKEESEVKDVCEFIEERDRTKWSYAESTNYWLTGRVPKRRRGKTADDSYDEDWKLETGNW